MEEVERYTQRASPTKVGLESIVACGSLLLDESRLAIAESAAPYLWILVDVDREYVMDTVTRNNNLIKVIGAKLCLIDSDKCDMQSSMTILVLLFYEM